MMRRYDSLLISLSKGNTALSGGIHLISFLLWSSFSTISSPPHWSSPVQRRLKHVRMCPGKSEGIPINQQPPSRTTSKDSSLDILDIFCSRSTKLPPCNFLNSARGSLRRPDAVIEVCSVDGHDRQ